MFGNNCHLPFLGDARSFLKQIRDFFNWKFSAASGKQLKDNLLTQGNLIFDGIPVYVHYTDGWYLSVI